MKNKTVYYIEHLFLLTKSLTPAHRKRFYGDLAMHLVGQDAIIEAQARTIETLRAEAAARRPTASYFDRLIGRLVPLS